MGDADTCDTVDKVREKDPQRDCLMTVVMQCNSNLVMDQTYTVQNVIERAVNVSSFYNALFAVAASRTGGAVSNDKLGRWLKRIEGKIIHGFKLMQHGN